MQPTYVKYYNVSDSEDWQTNVVFNYVAIYLQVDVRLELENGLGSL